MSEEQALVPVDEKQVEFYGDELTAVQDVDGRIYAGLRQMCHLLGIDTQGQRQRINRHKILNDGLGVCKLHTPSGGAQQAHVLRVDLVPLWLSGIRVSAIREDLRPKLEHFQREAAAVLWEAFQGGRLTADPTFDELMKQDTPEARAVRIAEAVLQLARSDLITKGRVDDHERRLEAIEAQLGDPGRHVNPDQASQISQAVKTVAMKLSKASGRNEYGGVYGELYRKFGITSYKQLPAAKFDEAMGWLNEWREGIEGDMPF